MKSISALKLTIILGVMLSTALAAAKTAYPPELEFLSDRKTPTYFSASGIIDAVDSTGKALVGMPFRMYWEKGNYTFDIRMPGGGPAGFFKGVADTVWVLDFMRGIKLVTLFDVPSGMGIGIPFSPKDVLMLFNLLPGGLDEIDTFYNEGSSLFVMNKQGTTFEFDAATKRPKSIKGSNTGIVFSDFFETKNGFWPRQVELKAGIIFPEAERMIVKAKEIGFKKETDRELLTNLPDIRFAREFDIRQQQLQNR